MKKLDKKYSFKCPTCKNTFQAKPEEIEIRRISIRFMCPICNKKKSVWNNSVTIKMNMNSLYPDK